MDRRNIVVIGGSAGALPVVKQVVRELTPDFGGSLFIVIHFPSGDRAFLQELLRDCSALPVVVAADGQPIEPGRVYLASPDHHLVLTQGAVRLGRGPKENMARPAIDPLFRSAALAYGPRVVAVLLSGYLNDGVAGLRAVRSRGGLTLVQDPLDADVPYLPEAALADAEPDQVLIGARMGKVLAALVRHAAPAMEAPADATLELEVRIALGGAIAPAKLATISAPTTLTCPHCQGVLSEITTNGPLRYRCQTGHAFTAEALFADQQDEVEQALVVALRIVEERVTLVKRMAEDAHKAGHATLAKLYESRTAEYERYAATLREAARNTLMGPEAAE